jgi:hypothetical protein
MRTRIAVMSILVGLVLFATALVHYVTARDVQRQEPTAPLRGIPIVVGLLAVGAALGAGGAAVLARWSRPALMMLGGVILLGTAGLLYLYACDARRHEQAVLDQRRAEVARQATGRFPPALPGGRPAPVPLRGLPVVFGLVACGIVLCVGGLSAVVRRPGSPRPQREPHWE